MTSTHISMQRRVRPLQIPSPNSNLARTRETSGRDLSRSPVLDTSRTLNSNDRKPRHHHEYCCVFVRHHRPNPSRSENPLRSAGTKPRIPRGVFAAPTVHRGKWRQGWHANVPASRTPLPEMMCAAHTPPSASDAWLLWARSCIENACVREPGAQLAVGHGSDGPPRPCRGRPTSSGRALVFLKV